MAKIEAAKVLNIGILFDNKDYLTVEKKDILDLNLFGLFTNVTMNEKGEVIQYQTCNDFDVSVKSDLATEITNRETNEKISSSAADRIKQGDLTHLFIKMDNGAEFGVYLPYDKLLKIQQARVRDNSVLVEGHIPD